ncbi:hypothetical protein [Streptomyces malaysiensis]
MRTAVNSGPPGGRCDAGRTTNDPEKALVLFGREAFGLDVRDPML